MNEFTAIECRAGGHNAPAQSTPSSMHWGLAMAMRQPDTSHITASGHTAHEQRSSALI